MAMALFTDDQIRKALEESGSIPAAAKALGMKYDTLQKRVRRMAMTSVPKSPHSSIRRYIVTSAQDSTAVHEPFLASLLSYCDHVNARLIVIPVNYENITLTSKNGKQEKWWPASLVKYLCHERVPVNDNLVIMGDVSVNATNVNPLTGLQTITGKSQGCLDTPSWRCA